MTYDIALRDCLIKRREIAGVHAAGGMNRLLASMLLPKSAGKDSPPRNTRYPKDVVDLFANVPVPARGAWRAIHHSGATQ